MINKRTPNRMDAGRIARAHEVKPVDSPEDALGEGGNILAESPAFQFTRNTMERFLRCVLAPDYLARAIKKSEIIVDENMSVYKTNLDTAFTSQPSINFFWTNDPRPVLVARDNLRHKYSQQGDTFHHRKLGEYLSEKYRLSKSMSMVHAGVGALAQLLKAGVPNDWPVGEYLFAGVCTDINGVIAIPSLRIQLDSHGAQVVTWNLKKTDNIIGKGIFVTEYVKQ